MENLEVFKESLKELNLSHDQYFAIVYAAIELNGSAKLEGMTEMQKIYSPKKQN